METLYIGYSDGLVRATVNGRADASWVMRGSPVPMISVDPSNPDRVYAATLGEGLWRSDDGGRSFERLSALDRELVWSVAVSASDVSDGVGAVYAGTQLTALFRSTDGGDTWEELTSVQEIPSLPEWSFPPAPDTHHLHQITLDHQDPDVIVFGVELGGVYRSSDRGETWSRTSADPDPHTLRTHPTARGRMYEGGGTAFHESADGGASWTRNLTGMPDEIRYFYSLAVDTGDPDNVIISGARDPFSGHAVAVMGLPTWSSLYRLEHGAWTEIREGLPDREGTAMGTLAAGAPGVFYYVVEDGDLYRSDDGGQSFRLIPYGDDARGKGARAAVLLHA